MSPTDPLLVMRDVNKRFQGVQALSAASLEVDPGEIMALVGLGPKLHVVKDAVVCSGIEPKSFFEKWQQAGVELITFDQLKLEMLN